MYVPRVVSFVDSRSRIESGSVSGGMRRGSTENAAMQR